MCATYDHKAGLWLGLLNGGGRPVNKDPLNWLNASSASAESFLANRWLSKPQLVPHRAVTLAFFRIISPPFKKNCYCTCRGGNNLGMNNFFSVPGGTGGGSLSTTTTPLFFLYSQSPSFSLSCYWINIKEQWQQQAEKRSWWGD